MTHKFFSKKFLTLFICSLIVKQLRAEIPKPTWDAFLDTTFTYNLNNPMSQTTRTHSFDRQTGSLLMNALQFNVSGLGNDGIGYYGELAFGTDPSYYKARGTNNPGETGLPTVPSNAAYSFDIQELFLTYKSQTYPFIFKLGKFEKLSGLEAIESMKNFNITRGSIFTLAQPFTHVGLMVGYQTSQLYDFWFGVINGWNVVTDNNKGKTIAMKLGLNLSETLYGNSSLYYGSEDGGRMRTSFDTSWFLKPNPQTTVGLQLNLGREEGASITDKNSNGVADGGEAKWYAFGIQPKYEYSDRFSIGAIYEYFYDVDGARAVNPFFSALGAVNGVIIQNIGFTPAFKLTESCLFRLQYSYEWATRDGYEHKDGTFSKNSASIFATELIYKF